MAIDAWLPKGFTFKNGVKAKRVINDGGDWQIYDVDPKGKILVAKENLTKRWLQDELLAEGALNSFKFGDNLFHFIFSEHNYVLEPVADCKSPSDRSEALAFAEAFRITRELDSESPLQDAIYVEKYSRILPTYGLLNRIDDDIILGYWLTGGVPVSINSGRRFRSLTNWLGTEGINDVIAKSGVKITVRNDTDSPEVQHDKGKFSLAGRPDLERFLTEHVIDIIENQDRYKALGIDFPSAIILYGPPGCGKTFAIERLVEYLEWPNYQIEASSVASPYIHETSKKVAAIFEQAMQNAPSVIVIDEMEAFLTDRQAGSGHHHVEEVAEFLRRIPEAVKNNVLVVGMTNKLDMIDPAILRRGRFDHVVKVDMASETEVLSLLEKLVGHLPQEPGIDLGVLAKKICGRPLSDVSFIVREGARLAVRSGKNKIDQECLSLALESSPSRNEDDEPRKIGFIF